MLSKIIVTILVWMMGATDTMLGWTGIDYCWIIDNLNEVAYKIEEVL